MATSEALTSAVRQLLAEGFEGASAGTTWFVDDQGLLGSIQELDAARASRPTSPEGSTVAAHVEHVRWFVALLNAFARGERPAVEWAESWTVREVDGEAWASLQADPEREFRELSEHLARGVEVEDPERLMPVLATVAHVAYHLGAVRQMVKAG
jgi:hypothetical protein